MKQFLRNALLLATLLAAQQARADVAINATNFPDPIWRQGVLDYLDGDYNGTLSDDEMQAVIYIGVGGWNVTSLTGLNYFPNLKYLDCNDNPQLTFLDLTGCNQLETLNAYNCPKLESITWGDVSHITYLAMQDDVLLPGFSLTTFQSLSHLNIERCTSWGKTLDISGTMPHSVYFAETGVEHVIAKGGAWLEWFDGFSGLEQVKRLDGGGHPDFPTVDAGALVWWSNLEILDMSNSQTLKTFATQNPKLTSLNLSGCNALEQVYVTESPKLTAMTLPEDVSHITTLALYGDSLLTGFSLTPFISLYDINIERCTSWGDTLDISGLHPQYIYYAETGIETFIAHGGSHWWWQNWNGDDQIRHLDISNDDDERNVRLDWLGLFPNLESLDISNCTHLSFVDIPCPLLTSFKVDNCPNLVDLRFGHTRVPQFDIAAKLPQLEALYLDRQGEDVERPYHEWYWDKLDVSGLAHLQELNVYNNSLYYLNLEENKEMTYQYGLWEQYPQMPLVILSANEVGIPLDNDFKVAKVRTLTTDGVEKTPKTTTVDGQLYYVVHNSAASAPALVGKYVYYEYMTGYVPGDVELQVRGTVKSVTKCPSFIKLSTSKVNGTYGGTVKAPTVTRSQAYDGALSYTSSNEDVVTVASDGKLTIVGAGTATITVSGAATAYRQAPEAQTYTVTIKKASPVFQFASATLEMTIQDDVPANALSCGVYDGTVTYTSSNTDIATVSGTGKVTVKAAGTVTITASANATANCNKPANASYTLTINKKTAAIQIASATVNGTWGKSITAPTITTTNGYDGTLSYASSNKNVVTVNASGKLTVVGAGTATITVTATETALFSAPVKATYKVVIAKATPDFHFETDNVVAYEGFTLNPLTTGIYDGTVTYSSSNDEIATVDPETGEVSFLALGTVTITAAGPATKNCNAVSATYNLEVTLAVGIASTKATFDDGRYYTVDGVAVDKPVKGRVYVRNGKKVMYK